ncbi:MAG: glycosyltransferase family 9 protein [Agriterribacter sp.]
MKLPGSITKIGIFRALQLGDLLCSIPAVRALRRAYPLANITLIGLPWARTLLDRFPRYFDDFLHFPGYHGLPEQPFDEQKYEHFLQEARVAQFDLLLQMQGNGTIVNEMLADVEPRVLAGFYNEHCLTDSPFFVRYPEDRSEIHRHLALMEKLGIPSAGDALEFPLYERDRQDFEDLSFPFEPGSYICFHPGSRGHWRQWPPSHFALMADYCYAHGYNIVITGTEQEKEITGEVRKRLRSPSIDLTGKTSLGTIALLIKQSRMLFSNCTGVSHIASAVQTPSVIISMDGQANRWAPLNKYIHRVIDWSVSHDLTPVFDQVNAILQQTRMDRTQMVKA